MTVSRRVALVGCLEKVTSEQRPEERESRRPHCVGCADGRGGAVRPRRARTTPAPGAHPASPPGSSSAAGLHSPVSRGPALGGRRAAQCRGTMALRSLLLSVRYGGGGEDSSYPRGQVTESRGRCFQVSSGIHAHPGSDGPLLLCVLPTPPAPTTMI